MSTLPSLDMYKRLCDSLRVGLWLVQRERPDDDESFTVIYCNEAGARSIPVPRQEFMHRRIIDVFPNIRGTGFLERYVETLASGVSQDAEMSYRDDRYPASVFRITFTPLAANLLGVIFEDVTEERRSQTLLEQRRQTIEAMSTPVIELWHNILLLPLIGDLDAQRTQQMLEHLLDAIATHAARVAIFDITGVPSLTSQVAHHLIQSVNAARMLGAQVLLTGIGTDTAITLVQLGIDVGSLRTHRSLHRGITAAFTLLGLHIG